MATKKYNNSSKKYKTEYRDMSGKEDRYNIPGQFRLCIEDPDFDGLVEQRPITCSKYWAKQYYEALGSFLDKSGVFARTWHLYKAIKDDNDHLCEPDSDKNFWGDQLADHTRKMKEFHHCADINALYEKAQKEYKAFYNALDYFIRCSERANVPFTADEAAKKAIMMNFFHLDDRIRGNCRRSFYRETFVDKAEKAFKECGYYQPISFRKMEEQFNSPEGKKYQEKFLAKKRRDKEKKQAKKT